MLQSFPQLCWNFKYNGIRLIMDKQIDFKTTDHKQVRSYFKVLNKDQNSDLFKATDLLVFETADHSKLLVDAYGTGILDFHTNSFNGCITTNSIYFWEDPVQQLMEIHRVLRPGKKLTLAFIEKQAGEKFPWTLPDFTFYTIHQVEQLFQNAGFVNIQVKHQTKGVVNRLTQGSTTPFVIISGQKQIV